MEVWRRVWRVGLAPCLSAAALEALRLGLCNDDRRLVQGAICSPPALHTLSGQRVESACALGYCGWQGAGLATAGAVEDYFQQICDGADERMAERAVCRFFLDWYDDTPRDSMRQLLLAEVEETLGRRCLNSNGLQNRPTAAA
jgi:hypothetical protein